MGELTDVSVVGYKFAFNLHEDKNGDLCIVIFMDGEEFKLNPKLSQLFFDLLAERDFLLKVLNSSSEQADGKADKHSVH